MQSNRLATLIQIHVCSGLLLLMPLLGSCDGPPTGGNGDDPPPPVDRVDVRILGQGDVNQTVSGTNATLTAAPDDGWEFSGWSGADVPSTENPITVDLGEVTSITATFVPAGNGGPSPRDDRDGDGVVDDEDNCVTVENPFQSDADLDGRGDLCDNCPDAANAAQVNSDADEFGDACDNCPGITNSDQLDTDGDGTGNDCEGDRDSDDVLDDDDNCPDVANAEQANSDGDEFGDACDNCSDVDNADQADGDEDSVGDVCDNCLDIANADQSDADEDGIGDACDVPGGGGPPPPGGPVCGNGVRESGEGCDDGNTVPGDGCDANCFSERPENDDCVDAIMIFDGDSSFNNLSATTDGPDEPATCAFEFGTTQVNADVWFCYEATCNGIVVASLCGSDYDTKLAVYEGCTCPPTQAPLGCSDDDCGAGSFFVHSRLTFQTVQGQSYSIRIGGFTIDDQGVGTLAIRCDENPLCGSAAGACFATDGNGSPGCDDATCCDTTCATDPFCCDVNWDATCAAEAQGLCTGSFTACSTSTGGCDAGNNGPGCDDENCCNLVCAADPFCCAVEWDGTCASEAVDICGLTRSFGACSASTGACDASNGGAGCEDESCCNLVCAIDPFCCEDTWDGLCATQAAGICGLNCGTTGALRNNACDVVAVPGVNTPVAGCSDEPTCKNVCTTASECCLQEWGQKCVCLANPNDPCCVAVCAVDSSCCSTEWNDLCDQRAADLCTP